MVNSIGDKIADVMLKAVEEAAELEDISGLTDSEKVLDYLVRYSAWHFAVRRIYQSSFSIRIASPVPCG